MKRLYRMDLRGDLRTTRLARGDNTFDRTAAEWQSYPWTRKIKRKTLDYMPGKPPLAFMACIWRMAFFMPPPLNIFIICCIC